MQNTLSIEPAKNTIVLQGSSWLSLDGDYYYTKLYTGSTKYTPRFIW